MYDKTEIWDLLEQLPKKDLSHEEIQEKLYEISCKQNEDVNKISERLFNEVYSFQKGVIMFIDFLGWKGSWLNEQDTILKDVSSLIIEIEAKLYALTQNLFKNSNNVTLSRLISISDTIAIFTPHIDGTDVKELIEMHACLARFILEKTTHAQYPVRGAITYGEYNIKGNIMMGPGIDECASWHEKTDWVGVILSPSTQFQLPNEYESQNIVSYDKIPFKSKVPLKYCVNWNLTDQEFNALTQKTRAMLPDISIKYLNTRDFLSRDNKEGK